VLDDELVVVTNLVHAPGKDHASGVEDHYVIGEIERELDVKASGLMSAIG